MSATELLRRLLDERGGFRVDFDREGARRTCWKIDDEQDGYCYFDEDSFGATQLTMTGATPAQAIAATLGSCNCSSNCTNGERTETCHIDLVGYNQHEDRFQCRSCDWSMWFKRGTWPQFNFCPNCGRRIVEPTKNDVDVEVAQ